MGIGVHLILTLLTLIIRPSICQSWGDPELSDEGIHPLVKFEGSSSFRQIITMDEEIPPNYKIAKINYKGDKTPRIGLFIDGTIGDYLGATIQKAEDDYYYIVVTKQQDYEQPDMRKYNFQVVIEGFTTVTVFLIVNNIDDNEPVVIPSPCTIPELMIGKSDCYFKVTDRDGWISTNAMKFSISGRSNEENLLHVKNYNTTEYEIWVNLETVEELDFFENQLHIFDLIATDTAQSGSATIILKVKDMPNRDPEWRKVYATQRSLEKTEFSFSVSAVDGDTEINKRILYRLDREYPFINVNSDTGEITVSAIDRDEEENEIFNYQILAYKYDNFSWATSFDAVLIIDDINDQIPNFNELNFEIDIKEETYVALDFPPGIICHDRDLGQHADYTVSLETSMDVDAVKAFQVVPEAGYQRQEFKLVIMNASMLDYDDEKWQKIVLEMVSTERNISSHTNRTTITINLINWNDEIPIFDEEVYTFSISERIKAGDTVGQVKATDRDIDDELIYAIRGIAQDFLEIDSKTGEITVSVDDYFDYHRQNEIFVQVTATDTLGDDNHHTVNAQVIINLEEVPDRTPQIEMPRSAISVYENEPDGYKIANAIIVGTDLDTTADLNFYIDWEKSLAQKPGKSVEKKDYIGCVEIVTEVQTTNNRIRGQLVVKQIDDSTGQTIDYEAFEMLFLNIVLNDTSQKEGISFTEVVLPITINDVNDNPPVWVDGTLEAIRIVREEAATGTVIGTIRAVDIDGPEFNVVRYIISPVEERWSDSVVVDDYGELTVLDGDKIDADLPPTFDLVFNVIATDCKVDQKPEDICFNTSDATISIQIIDTNNKNPYTLDDDFDKEITIPEDTKFGEVVQILSKDHDRDDPYNNVSYSIDYRFQEDLRELFIVDRNNGSVLVYLQNGKELDRDHGITYHDMTITLTDNDSGGAVSDFRKNTNETRIKIVLEDVNDNAPQFIMDYEWTLSENTGEDHRLEPEVEAEDIDEGDNAKVQYNMTLTPVDPEQPSDFETFLRMDSPDNVTGVMYTTKPLKGFWGKYDIFIVAFDLGIPQMSSNGTFTLTVTPYNYMKPEFTYPIQNEVIRLHKEQAQGRVLQYPNGTSIKNFHARDTDGSTAGIVTFELLGSDSALEYFTITNLENDNECRLSLNKPIDNELVFDLSLRATDQGEDPGPKETTVEFSIRFITVEGEAYFKNNIFSGNLTEFEVDENKYIEIPPAENPRDEACKFDDCEIENTIYYYIYDVGSRDLFKLVEGDIIKLQPIIPLNRTESELHTVRIIASYKKPMPSSPESTSILTVTVNVKDHDPRPVFLRNEYTAGVGSNTEKDTSIITVNANHTENLAITYTIEKIEITDNTLESNKDSFQLDENTGVLKILFVPLNYMQGMFNIHILGTDSVGKTGTTLAKVFLITAEHRLSFIFKNLPEEVGGKSDIIANIFSLNFGYTCIIHDVLSFGRADDQTELISYFVGADSLPIDARIIDGKKNDARLMEKLNNELLAENLHLQDFNSNNSGNSSESLEEMLKIILIVVTTILAILCIVLLITYCIKTRSLKRRLNALSTTKFGSQDSGLNRIGVGATVAVPGTNKHAIEGSNPVFHNEVTGPQMDTISETSGDSDLIGIEDNPQFYYGDKC